MNNRKPALEGYEPKTLQECITAPSIHLGRMAGIFYEGKEQTITGLSGKLGVNRTTVRKYVDFLMQRKFVYISRWDNSHGHVHAAVFRAGNKPNAAPPPMKTVLKVKEVAPPPPKNTFKPIDPTINLQYLKDLSAALVPQRTEQEQYEVNWAYWNHLARRAA